MDEYQHLRESADVNRASGRHAHLIDGRIVPQDHTHGSPDPTYPAEPIGATALERQLGIPPNFAAGRLRSYQARQWAGIIRARTYAHHVEKHPEHHKRLALGVARFAPGWTDPRINPL